MNITPSAPQPESGQDVAPRRRPQDDEGTNRTQSEPNPQADPAPPKDGKFIPKSPYTTGNS